MLVCAGAGVTPFLPVQLHRRGVGLLDVQKDARHPKGRACDLRVRTCRGQRLDPRAVLREGVRSFLRRGAGGRRHRVRPSKQDGAQAAPPEVLANLVRARGLASRAARRQAQLGARARRGVHAAPPFLQKSEKRWCPGAMVTQAVCALAAGLEGKAAAGARGRGADRHRGDVDPFVKPQVAADGLQDGAVDRPRHELAALRPALGKPRAERLRRSLSDRAARGGGARRRSWR